MVNTDFGKALDGNCKDKTIDARVSRLAAPVALGIDDAGGRRTADVHRLAAVHADDPDAAGAGAHAQVAVVKLPVHIGPLGAAAPPVDRMEDDACAQLRQLVR